MSLNRRQVAATRDELAANLARSGRTDSDLAADLHVDVARVRAALAVDGVAPEDVWLVRDHLDREIRRAGGVPVAYSTLTEQARAAARGWVPLVDLEEHEDGGV